jgi:hypothetical protein
MSVWLHSAKYGNTLRDRVPPSLHPPFDHRLPGGILTTVRHKSKALPRENEVADVEAVFKPCHHRDFFVLSFFGVCNMSWTRFPHTFVHMSAPCPNPGTRQPLRPS